MARLLKHLELNGFKSFAQRSVLEFPEGITAIVGPNGSGKSNVVDAIRWLLGEREAKQLRGGKIDDLIFAGTPKRPRMGQAQATLYFENYKHFFPVDYEEVAITRQVNRDGASQYFLNKSEILLRDLVDFYAKVRLGARGMTVITQGNSDLFIQATPVGRREMIEEILGLREYQLKKAEAQRRLKNSQINLEKVQALIEEILPHLRSLKRQTGRWERRGALEEELRQLENFFFGTQLRQLNTNLSQVNHDIEKHKHERITLDEALQTAQRHQAQIEADEPSERQQLKEVKEQMRGLLESRSQLQKEIGRLEARLELEVPSVHKEDLPPAPQLAQALKNVEKLLQAAPRESLESLRQAVQAALSEISKLFASSTSPSKKESGSSGELRSQFEDISGKLQEMEKQIASLHEQESSLEKNQEKFYELFKAAVAHVEKAKDEIERWETQNRQRLFEKERLELRLDELKRQIEHTGRRVEEFASLADQSENPAAQTVNAEDRIYRLRGELANMGEVDEALVKEARETEERYQFLQQQAQDLEKAIDDLRRLIKELQEKIRGEFSQALVKINREFRKFFELMFGGGEAQLSLQNLKAKAKAKPQEDDEAENEAAEDEQEEEEKEEGVEVAVRLPKKRITSLEVLSGGERSLVGIAALFALISVSPPPFLVLDEIDAPLDERNARRFAQMLKEFSKQTQFIVVTHNRATMEAADVLYGITLEEDGSSKVLSLKLGD